MRLVAPAAGRTVEDDEDDDDYEDYSLYTDEDYAELEQAFEFTFWDAFDNDGKDSKKIINVQQPANLFWW